MVYNKTLNQLCQCYNEVFRSSNRNNRVYNRIVVRFLIKNFTFLCNQFLNDICIILRQCFSHFGSRVFGGYRFAHLDQTIQRDLVPVLHIFFCLFYEFHFFLRVVDECGKRTFICRSERMPEYIIDFLSHSSGSIAQHMGKRLIFPVNICQKMLRTFWQIQNRLQIDNLRCSGSNRWI